METMQITDDEIQRIDNCLAANVKNLRQSLNDSTRHVLLSGIDGLLDRRYALQTLAKEEA